MIRLLSLGLVAVAFCALQSGCCCCRLPIGQPIVVNPPQVVVNAPPMQPPPVKPPPIPPANDKNAPKDNPAKDASAPKEKDAAKDKFVVPGQEKPKEYVYKVSTGELKLGDELIGKGYSGKGAGKNNSAFEKQKDIGPIPTGDYMIIQRHKDAKSGEVWFKTNLFVNSTGRWPSEEFHIYYESNPPGNNPAGYIVLPPEARSKIEYRENPYNRLKVVP
jgi:hypothetical protein